MSFATVVASSILGKLLASLSPREIMTILGGLLRVVGARQPRPSVQKLSLNLLRDWSAKPNLFQRCRRWFLFRLKRAPG